MRDYSAWRNRRGLARALREEWMPTTDQPDVGELLDTELGLYVLQTVAPGERPEAVWTLLSGYRSPRRQASRWALLPGG